jgi:hypothetical protein
MNPLEVLYNEETDWGAFREMSPEEFHAKFTLHDSHMKAGLLWCPGDDSVLLIFSCDIFDREILDWDSDEWPYLFLEIRGVTAIYKSDQAKRREDILEIIGGAETVVVESGFVTSIDGILQKENIMIEHSGGFRVLFTSTEGDVIKFKKE